MIEPATAPRWTLHRAFSEQDEEVLALFEQVFGHAMPLAQWRWKYAQAPMRGLMLRRGGALVGFYGAMPRKMASAGALVNTVQNGDVMVLPGESVLGRHGAMQRLVTAYVGEFVGPGKDYEFAYGFPNERAFRLGVKLGIYIEAAHLWTATWAPAQQTLPWWLREEEMSARELGAIERLWAGMRKDWADFHIPVRDAAYWQSRFLSHPTNQYRLVLLKRRWTGQPVCALVLRRHPGHVEWLDFVGSASAVPLAVAAGRRMAARCGNQPLIASFSQPLASRFAAEAATCQPSPVHVPVDARPSDDHRSYVGRLWLMGGDTDFM
jgi:hypothetical protein